MQDLFVLWVVLYAKSLILFFVFSKILSWRPILDLVSTMGLVLETSLGTVSIRHHSDRRYRSRSTCMPLRVVCGLPMREQRLLLLQIDGTGTGRQSRCHRGSKHLWPLSWVARDRSQVEQHNASRAKKQELRTNQSWYSTIILVK
jgi:hypothetical protein